MTEPSSNGARGAAWAVRARLAQGLRAAQERAELDWARPAAGSSGGAAQAAGARTAPSERSGDIVYINPASGTDIGSL
jgi:hypothetical protein